MICAYCNGEFPGKPVKQGTEYYCSLECANLASGIAPEDNEEYFEEEALDQFYKEDE